VAGPLAGCDDPGELRQRADRGSYPALHELAEWLARHPHLDELRPLVAAHSDLLAGWLARQFGMGAARAAAELGDVTARRRVQM
jgi:hypothetical protein